MSNTAFVVTVPMPFTGESIVDGILVNWLVEPGDKIAKGQNIAEIETEKSVWEFEAPCEGEIVALRAEPGDVVEVKAPLIDIRTDDEDVKHLLNSDNGGKADAADVVSPLAKTGPKPGSNGGGQRVEASPRVRRMLKDAGIDEKEALTIPHFGDRLTANDVEAYLSRRSEVEAEPAQKVTTYLAGIGAYVPDKVVENSFFTPHFEDIDETYIEKVTGIRERRWVEEETTSDMAFNAAEEALQNAGIEAADLDMIILATTTADMPLPASACMLQQKLGCTGIPAFDIQAACSGWLYGLSIAQTYLKAGVHKNILVVASETMSRFTNHTDRATAFLFGDGAGAAVVSSVVPGHEMGEIVLTADSSGYDIIYRKAGGSLMPPREMETPKDEFWYMDGGRMFRTAVAAFSGVIESVAFKAKNAIADIAWFVPHQANMRILKSVANRLKADPEKFFSNIKLRGNTSAASIPLALKDLQKSGGVKSGDKVILCAVGAGLTSAGCAVTWK